MILRVALLVAAVQISLAAPTLAWNDTGHFIVSRLAWRQLSPEQRAKATAILKTHPHYAEYLSAEKPEGIDADEWAFWRASYWPDWAREHYSDEYNKPTWHYISAGFVPPYSKLDPAKLELPGPNVVTQITAAVEKLRSGTGAEKPIYLCWVLHLVADIHQPLHNCSLLTETFPMGDRGGNDSLVRVGQGDITKLHRMFDFLLGDDPSPAAIAAAIVEIDQAQHAHAETIERELKQYTTPADWSKEGFALAVKFAYLDGALRPANAQAMLSDADVPSVAGVYVESAEKMARVQAAKAGRRLAASLAQGLDGKPGGISQKQK